MYDVKSAVYLFLALTLCFNGCTLAPEYTRPPAPVPAEWPGDPADRQVPPGEEASLAAAEMPWQEFFQDDNLRRVIGEALANNRDLRIAALNVELARALYGIQRAELYPPVYAAAVGGKQGLSRDLVEPGRPRTSEQYSASLAVFSWEIDFFGRLRSLSDRAREEYFASRQARRSAQILLISALAEAYLALAADRENLSLAESTLVAQEETFQMVQRQFRSGVVSELQLRQAESQMEAARQAVAGYRQQVAQDENALTFLTGGNPPAPELLPAALDGVRPPKEIFAGASSEVLLHRPDVLQAEALLKAQNADIGAARAAFFPRLTLTTALGTASDELHRLFDPHTGVWNYVPQAVLPVFDARVWSALRATKVKAKIALAEYEKAIQNAFRETVDVLAVRGAIREQLAAQEALVNALSEVQRLSRQRYEKGLDSYLTVLDAERSLFAARQALTRLRLAELLSRVRLYTVLGGGGEPGLAGDEN